MRARFRANRTKGSAPKFNECRRITARRPGPCANTATCKGDGEVRVGDVIGYGYGHAFCPACWAAWCEENADADADERAYEAMNGGRPFGQSDEYGR